MTYSKIHANSPSSATSALDLFSAPITKTSVIEGTDIELGPIGNPSATDIDFSYEASGANYIDGQKTTLHVQCKVTKANGAAIGIGDAQKVFPVTNLLHTLFSTIQLSYGSHLITYADNHPYVAYFENLLNSGEGSKRSTDQAHMWIYDDTGVIDTSDLKDEHGSDINKRKVLIDNGKTIDLFGTLNLSLLMQERYLPPGAPIKLRLTRSSDAFCLMRSDATDTTNYKISISKCCLNLGHNNFYIRSALPPSCLLRG